MNNKIKEILEEIKDYSEHEYLPPCCELTNEDCKILSDYITNLQTIEQQYSAILSENAELNNKITNLQERCEYLERSNNRREDTILGLRQEISDIEDENEKLKNGYCNLKVKCNNGECDCTNEEYEGMVQSNMRGSLLLEDYKSRNEKAIEKINCLIEVEKKETNYDRFYSDNDYEITKLNDIKNTLQGENKDE